MQLGCRSRIALNQSSGAAPPDLSSEITAQCQPARTLPWRRSTSAARAGVGRERRVCAFTSAKYTARILEGYQALRAHQGAGVGRRSGRQDGISAPVFENRTPAETRRQICLAGELLPAPRTDLGADIYYDPLLFGRTRFRRARGRVP
jgi:hypothetical protein